MKATATAPSNGVEKNKNAQPPAQTATPNPVLNAPGMKVENPKEEPKTEPVKPVRTIHEELERIRMRSELADKLEQVIATKARLEAFRISATGMREKLTITDGLSQEFTTSNTAVIEAVYKVICTTVDEKIAGIEAELLATA